MSISQSTIKFISSLQQKKFRQNYHKFVVEGTKIIGELLQQQRFPVTDLYATEEWIAGEGLELQSSKADSLEQWTEPLLRERVRWQQFPTLHRVSPSELKRLSGLRTPHRVLAVVDRPVHPPTGTQNARITEWSLYLDAVQSPANLGAILRVADWFGFQQVFAGPGTADLFNPKSLQATMGCFLRLDYREVQLTELLAGQPELPVFAADLKGENIYRFDPPAYGLLVIGNEGRGIQPDTRELVTDYLKIPRVPGRQAESLNAAVAAGIMCGALVNSQ